MDVKDSAERSAEVEELRTLRIHREVVHFFGRAFGFGLIAGCRLATLIGQGRAFHPALPRPFHLATRPTRGNLASSHPKDAA